MEALIQNIKQISKSDWQKTLYIMFVAQIVTAIGFSSIFPFLPLYVETLGSNFGISIELLSGLVFSSQAFTMMIASPFWGIVADRYGRKLMVQRATFGGSIVILMMAFVRSAEELVLLRGVQGLITGTLAAANALVASAVPREKTGYAMGVLQVGMGVGLALGPLIGGAVADWFGYAGAFYITSGMLFIAGLLVWFGIKEDVVLNQKIETGSSRQSFLSQWRHVLGAPGVLGAYGLRFLSQLGRMMLVPIAPLFILTLISSEAKINTFTGLVVAASSVTTTISSIYLGKLGDQIGHRKIVIWALVCAALIYIPHSLVSNQWQLLALQALVGVAMGGIIPAISALLANYTVHGEEGSVYGLDNSVNSGARAVAPLLSAAVALAFGLRATFLFTGIMFFLGFLFAFYYLPDLSENVGIPEGNL